MSADTIPSKTGPVFAKCRAENRAALIGYLPVGYPTVDDSLTSFRTMVDAGCDIIEVGVPYSDPVMDGPTIQEAADLALTNGVRVHDVFRAVEAITAAGGNAVVMTYWNPVLQYGVDKFARDLANAGGAGLITPNLIPEEGAGMARGLRRARARPHLSGRAVVDHRTHRIHRRRIPRIRVRRIHHGRHRCA